MGAVAIVAAAHPTQERWLAMWLLTAVVAMAIAALTMIRKASRADVSCSKARAGRSG